MVMTLVRLRTWLKRNGLTQADLAACLAYSPGYVRRVVSGNQPLTAAFRWRFTETFGWDIGLQVLGEEALGEPAHDR
jgi:transcriptional regulator with XRE-family HTH domain